MRNPIDSTPGHPATASTAATLLPKHLQAWLAQTSSADKRAMFDALRAEHPIHPLEQRLDVPAELILEALSRSNDITLRGMRGIISEAAFKQYVLDPLLARRGWEELAIDGDRPFDFALRAEGHVEAVTIQVKMQRQKEQRPMLACEANRALFRGMTDAFVVETQRTRGGTDIDGSSTRTYKFGEFDILAVGMQPSSKNWGHFMFTLGSWLLPALGAPGELFKYQPVPRQDNELWTSSLEQAIDWLHHAAASPRDVPAATAVATGSAPVAWGSAQIGLWP